METKIIAKIKYFPSKGTTKDVGGIISTTSKKNTWRLMRIDIESVTYMKKVNEKLVKKKNLYMCEEEK